MPKQINIVINVALSRLSCAISQIFDVEKYRDLEIQDRGHSPCNDAYTVLKSFDLAIFCYTSLWK